MGRPKKNVAELLEPPLKVRFTQAQLEAIAREGKRRGFKFISQFVRHVVLDAILPSDANKKT